MENPSIMICFPTKDDSKHYSKFLEQWKNISYPKDKIRFVIVYGGREPSEVVDFLKRNNFIVEMHKEPEFENLTKNSSLWIADVLNFFKNLYKGEEYILMSDTDLSYLPPDLLQSLILVNKDVVAPYVWQEYDHNIFFDTYVFRYNGNECFPDRNPPFKNWKEPVELESVGTMFLIKAEVFLKVNWENPVPHLQFCKNARKLGYKIWALPYIHIRHAQVFGHPSIETYINTIPIEVIRKADSRI